MTYKCPQCEATSDKEGMCPTHNVPMVAVADAPADPAAAPATPAADAPQA